MGRGREEEGPVLSLTNCCCCLTLPIATRCLHCVLLFNFYYLLDNSERVCLIVGQVCEQFGPDSSGVSSKGSQILQLLGCKSNKYIGTNQRLCSHWKERNIIVVKPETYFCFWSLRNCVQWTLLNIVQAHWCRSSPPHLGPLCCLPDQGNTLFATPLVRIKNLLQLEDFRDLVLADLYGISPCTIPPIDTLTDVAFQVI